MDSQAYRCTRVWWQLEASWTQIAEIDLDRMEYSDLQLCHFYYIGGDRCGHLLANILQTQRQAAGIRAILDRNGLEHTDDHEIVVAFPDFYTEFYAKQDVPADGLGLYLQGACTPKLTSEQASHLGHLIRARKL
ncbi:hypothetical protein NDU88_005273 [Pleurodeles waltl]|uniref:Uncharacterized protein n=1 Tax=Pleurodeles waltl TaxID=8319 RepID=A0AAV7M8T7_PLEWA|nr:hypothetical protein NDU88_005273 [Pleurodeles waltl]